MHDSAVASVSPRSRSRSRTSSAVADLVAREEVLLRIGDELLGDRLGARSAPGCDEEVDVQLEVARADRHVDPVAVAARGGERLRDGRLRDAVEAEHAPLRAAAPARAAGAAAPSRARAARAPAARAAAPAARRPRSRPPRARRPAPCRRGRPRAHRPAASPACGRRPRSRRTAAPGASATRRESSSIAVPQRRLDVQPDTGRRASSSIVRSSCVGPSPPETHEQVVGETLRAALPRDRRDRRRRP